jgi:hypothetical protein
VFSSALFGKIGLSGFANQTIWFFLVEFLSIFSLSCNSGLEDMLYCVNFGVKTFNMFVNLNYACSCVLVISYPFHVLFMQICLCECLEIIGVCFLINMLSLEKLDDPVSQIGLSSFGRLTIYFSNFLIVVILLSCVSCITCSHTQNYCTYRMHRYRGNSLGFP